MGKGNYILYVILTIVFKVYPQMNTDTLKGKSYDYLQDGFMLNYDERERSIIYSSRYLEKAKIEGFEDKIAFGYHLMALSTEKEESLNYIDSLIEYTKDKKIPRYPVSGYMLKGQIFYERLEFKKTLDLCLLSDSLINKEGDDSFLYYENNRMIATLKGRIGNHKEAIDLYREALVYADSIELPYDYSTNAFAIAESFNFIDEPDSAAFYINKARKLILKSEPDLKFKDYLTAASVATEFNLGNYTSAIDSANAIYNFLLDENDLPNIAFLHYYKAKAFDSLGNKKQSIDNFKKVDSIFLITQDIHPELRDSWEKIIDYYQKENDVPNELKYVKRLLSADSILNDNYRYLNNNIYRKYDIPQLVQLKDNLIEQYKDENQLFSKRNTYLIIGLVILILSFLMYWLREKKRIRDFKRIIEHYENGKGEEPKEEVAKSKELPLSEDLYYTIDSKMKELEKKEFYLDSKNTADKVAKKIGHNYNYLSKYVNHEKGKNYTQYTNDLRIDYAIKKFKEDKSFRNWSLSAVAKEVGFNSTEYFSKAFKKRTNLTPTYFLKQLAANG